MGNSSSICEETRLDRRGGTGTPTKTTKKSKAGKEETPVSTGDQNAPPAYDEVVTGLATTQQRTLSTDSSALAPAGHQFGRSKTSSSTTSSSSSSSSSSQSSIDSKLPQSTKAQIRAERAERKAQRKAERTRRRAEKTARKALRRADRAQRKAQRATEKITRKAQRAREKAASKAQKAREKAVAATARASELSPTKEAPSVVVSHVQSPVLEVPPLHTPMRRASSSALSLNSPGYDYDFDKNLPPPPLPPRSRSGSTSGSGASGSGSGSTAVATRVDEKVPSWQETMAIVAATHVSLDAQYVGLQEQVKEKYREKR